MRVRKKIFYGWVIVGVSFLIMSIVYAVWYSFPLLYVPILDEFGWSRADTALIFSVGAIVYGIGSAIAGALLDAFGPRKTYTIATVAMVLGLVGCSRATEIWQFILFWGGLTSLGICMAGFVPCTVLVSNWFTRRRATAIGIAQAGGRESFILTPLIQSIILALGWQNTYLVLAVVTALLITGSVQFLRHSPKDMGLLPDGETLAEVNGKTVESLEDRRIVNKEWTTTDWILPRAVKEYRFWAIFSIMLTLGISYGIVLTHQVAFIVDTGFTAMFAAYLLLIFGIVSMAGRFCGFVSDMMGREMAYTLGCSGVVLGFLMLILIRDTSSVWLLYIYVVFFGFFSGLNSPTYSATAADIFQGRHFGALLGLANIGYGLGNSIGAWFAGYIYDTFGNYVPAFAVAMVTTSLACISLWISSPRKIRLVANRVARSQSE